jgi:hypothetical protein
MKDIEKAKAEGNPLAYCRYADGKGGMKATVVATNVDRVVRRLGGFKERFPGGVEIEITRPYGTEGSTYREIVQPARLVSTWSEYEVRETERRERDARERSQRGKMAEEGQLLINRLNAMCGFTYPTYPNSSNGVTLGLMELRAVVIRMEDLQREVRHYVEQGEST